jgi:hypothetical protein
MALLKMEYLTEVEESLRSGEFLDYFTYSSEESRQNMLAFLEKLMDLGELADEVATQIIFRKRPEKPQAPSVPPGE